MIQAFSLIYKFFNIASPCGDMNNRLGLTFILRTVEYFARFMIVLDRSFMYPRKKIRQFFYLHSGDKSLHEKHMKPSWKYMSWIFINFLYFGHEFSWTSSREFMKKSYFSLLFKCLRCSRNIQEISSKIIAFLI